VFLFLGDGVVRNTISSKGTPIFNFYLVAALPRCGDLPTDYISAADVKPPQHPRKAMRVFAQNWLEVVQAWKDGREIENTRIGDPNSHTELGPLLESRATLLTEWADDDSLWEEE
jgi:uncharacterized protein DUF4826